MIYYYKLEDCILTATRATSIADWCRIITKNQDYMLLQTAADILNFKFY